MKSKAESRFRKLAEKKWKLRDAFWLLIVIICISFVSQMSYRYDFKLDPAMKIEVPWLVKGDSRGNLFIVDKERTRVLKVSEGKLEAVIQGCNPSEDTFYYADNICVADNGEVFVLDTGWSTTGFSVDSETILRYDEDGRSMGVCYQVDYEDQYCDKHRIFGLEVRENGLYFVQADERGFSLRRIDIDTMECTVLHSWSMEEAITLIQDFIVDVENLGVYAVDKRGKLLYGDVNSDVAHLLYELPQDQMELEKTAFYRGAMGEPGVVYITDIASGRLLKLSEDNGYEPETVFAGSNMWNASYTRLASGEGQISYIADGAVCVADAMGESVEEFTQLEKSARYLGKELIFDLMALIGLVGLLYLLIRLSVFLIAIPYTNTQKIGILVICTVIAVSIILVYGLMGQFKDTYREELLTKLTMISQIVSNSMEEEEIEDVSLPQNYMNESYRNLWNKIDTIVDKNYGYSEDLYCNILRYDGREGYAMVYLDNSIGTYYPLTEEETEEIRAVYESGTIYQSDVQSETGSYIYVHTPIFGENGQVIGVVSVGTLSQVIDGKISAMTQNIIIAMIMIVLAIMFLFSEALSFYDLKERYGAAIRFGKQAVPMHVVRILIFVTFMAFNMSTSFLPVYIINFVREDMGIPSALANSLPMTMNLIAVGATSVFCPGMIKKLGFARIAAGSGIIALAGDVLMGMGANYEMILTGMILNGIGVGFITNSIHIFLAALSAGDGDAEGFSIFNAASLSGINCGMLFGSALAARIGQNSVFLISAGAWGIVALAFLLTGRRLTMRSADVAMEDTKHGLLKFIASPNILKFMICMQIPYIIMNSFTYYYVPIYGDENGLTENITSLLIIICSLCSVYLSVAATNYLTKRFQHRAMYLSTAITFAGLLLFAWKMTVFNLILALILIGIANSFGASTRTAFFIRMKESVRYGEDRAMGCYDLVDNLGESTGSIIFAGIVSVGFRTGILGLIGCVAGLNAVYALTGKRETRRNGAGNAR